MAKHLIAFGHGDGDTGTTSGNKTEAATVRKLKPYLEKWGKQSKDSFSFYNGNLFKNRAMRHQKSYDTVTEIHLDGPRGSGGHVIINSGFKPDNLDKRLRDVIKKHFGIVGYLQKSNGISNRNLYNARVAGREGINYRLLELFFLSNEKHYNHYISNLDLIAKEMVEAIVGAEVAGSAKPVTPQSKPSKPVKKPSVPKKQVSTGTYTGGSIVDYLNRNKISSSFANRKKLAREYLGISNYSGTAKQNTDLLNAMRSGKKKQPKATSNNVSNYKGGSIVDYLNLSGNKHLGGSSFNNRKKLAEANDIRGYAGTAAQNKQLLLKLQGGSVATPTRSVNVNAIAEQIKKGIDNQGRRIPIGHEPRRKHFGLTKDEYAKVRARVNQIM